VVALMKAKTDEESRPAPESTGKSTRSPSSGDRLSKMQTLDEALTEIETLKAKLADVEKRAALTDAEREAEIEKSDPVTYKGEVSGITVRKSEATTLSLAFAKQIEAGAKREAAANAEIAKAQEAVEIEKAAKATEILKARVKAEINHLPGSDDVKLAVLKAVEGIDGAVEMLRGADAFAAAKTDAPGIVGDEEPKADAEPQAELDALVAVEMAAKSVDRARAMDAVTKTTKGLALYTEVQKRIKARK
jgi:hypothetical protein